MFIPFGPRLSGTIYARVYTRNMYTTYINQVSYDTIYTIGSAYCITIVHIGDRASHVYTKDHTTILF